MPKNKIRIYFDTNVYGRPFDDLSIPKNALEAEAARILFSRIRQEEKLVLLGSDILKLEIQKIKDIQKKFWVSPLITLCDKWIEENEKVKELATEILSKTKLLPRDSIHLACAILGRAQYFLTFDNDFLKKSGLIEVKYKVKVIHPVDFLKSI